LAFLTSCSVGPDYSRPELNLPGKYDVPEHIEKASLDLNTEENDQGLWWKNFNDPILVQLIDLATADNLSLQSSLARIDEANSLSDATFAGLFPAPAITGQYIKNKTAPARFPGIASQGISYEIYSLAGSVAWEADLFGRIRRQYQSAEHQEAKIIFNSADLLTSIQAQISTAYFQLRGAQKQKEIAEGNFKTQSETLKILEDKFNVGVIGGLDLERARAQKFKTESLIFDYDTLINNALNRIAALTGRYPHDLPGDLLSVNYELPTYSGPIRIGKPFELLSRRPDIRAAEENAISSSAEIGVAIGDFYPKVSFNGTISRDSRDISNLSSTAAKAYNYGPNITWNILNFYQILNRVDAAKANAKANLIDYKNTIVSALEEVDNSLVNLNNLLIKADLLESAANSSVAAENIAKAKYDAGAIGFLDLLLSQSETLSSQSAYITAKTEVDLAYVNLFRVLGGTWEDADEETVP